MCWPWSPSVCGALSWAAALTFALPVIFPAVMVAGAVMDMFGMQLPAVELGIALFVTVLGS